MDESKWLESVHPAAMLELFRGKNFTVDLRRFAMACCRRIGHVDQPWFQNLLNAMERYLNDHGPEADVIAARNELQRVADQTAASETDDTTPLQRFDWDAFTAFRAAADFDGTYFSSPPVTFFAKGETEAGTAYSAAVLAAMSAAQSIATRTANSLQGVSDDRRVDEFLATERKEEEWQAQLVREIFGAAYNEVQRRTSG